MRYKEYTMTTLDKANIELAKLNEKLDTNIKPITHLSKYPKAKTPTQIAISHYLYTQAPTPNNRLEVITHAVKIIECSTDPREIIYNHPNMDSSYLMDLWGVVTKLQDALAYDPY